MRKFGRLTLIVALASTLLGLPATAAYAGTDGSVQPSKAPQAVHTDDFTAMLGCWVTPKPGVDAVRVRRSATTSSDILGTIQPGQSADAACTVTSGGAYTACGVTNSPHWVRVIWAGLNGYAAVHCTYWYYD